MTKKKPLKQYLEEIREKFLQNTPIHKTISAFGRLHIDRKLPFICLYRKPLHNDWGTSKLVRSEASYLVAKNELPFDSAALKAFKDLLKMMAAEFGTLLILDLFASGESSPQDGKTDTPQFIIHISRSLEHANIVETLQQALQTIQVDKRQASVTIKRHRNYIDQYMSPLLTSRQTKQMNAYVIGLEVVPIYRSADGQETYPLTLRPLRRRLSRALKQTFYDFATHYTTRTPRNYMALGRRAFVKAVYQVDKQLAEIDSSFDLLLQTSPINVEAAWNSFKKKKCDDIPKFIYRPLPFDPSLMKRKLFEIPIERIEDPILEHLMSEKQQEIDQKLSLLRLIDTKRFLYGSVELYGPISEELLSQAHKILESTTPEEDTNSRKRLLSPKMFAQLATREILAYQSSWPNLKATVQIREDLYAGLLVSQGHLLIGHQARIPTKRAYALICHEVGTHILTYYNGRAQPFEQLYIGLAGYDELQEGLGILAEYLVGGLTSDRMRTIAGRVVAVWDLIEGANFLEIFRHLHEDYGFSERMAFLITVRTCRAGGLTKDASYLRGLITLIDYLKKGGDLDILYIGKMGRQHVPLIRELKWRQVLKPMPLYPRFLKNPDSQKRLQALKKQTDLVDMIENK